MSSISQCAQVLYPRAVDSGRAEDHHKGSRTWADLDSSFTQGGIYAIEFLTIRLSEVSKLDFKYFFQEGPCSKEVWQSLLQAVFVAYKVTKGNICKATQRSSLKPFSPWGLFTFNK